MRCTVDVIPVRIYIKSVRAYQSETIYSGGGDDDDDGYTATLGRPTE